MQLTTEQANALLPQEKTKGIINPARLKYFMVTPPKFGKTTTACAIPNSVLLAFEEGHAFTETYKIIIDQWDRPFKEKQEGIGFDEDGNAHMSLAEAVQLICASDRFDNVIFDTADMAARMCVDYHCDKLKVKHPAEAGDYGVGYALTLTNPFRQMIGPIIKSGRGMFFTSHSKLVERKVGKDVSYKWESTLPRQAQDFIHSQCDVIWQGKFGKHRPGMKERDRILTSDASEERMAGTRVKIDNKLWPIPPSFILDPEQGWEQWASFFPLRNPDYSPNADSDDPESVEWLRTKEEARTNCERAYQEYLDLTVSKKSREREEVVAEAAPEPAPTEPISESPAPTEAVEPASNGEETPGHLATPKRVVRRGKPVTA